MFSKKFVSIYFSSNEIRIVQLTSKKDKVKVATTVQIPKGAIAGRSVANPELIGSLLRDIWSQKKIKEKSVGLVIPEFSTFTKTLDVPRVEKDELDEAVRWQAQEFLPWQEEETILDWKRLDENKDDFQVLFVAVRREVLLGYVNAVSSAGLFPIVVETPSLSLVRLSTTNNVGKFIFYGGNHSSIFIIARGEKIYGSSVLYSNQTKDLLSTTSGIINHYKDIQIESVEIDGPGATLEFSKELAKLLNKKVKLLEVKVGGLSRELMAQYLVPTSLQFKDPSEPSDEYTVNLLPLKWVKKYELKKLKIQVWSLSLVVSYVVWLTFFAALAAYIFLGQTMNQLQAQKGSDGPVDSGKIEAISEVQKSNQLADKVIAIDDATIFPQDVLNAIYSVRPDSVSINRYKLNLDKGKIELQGVSEDRISLIAFKQALEGKDEFSIVDVPLASLEVNKDLDFTMNFNYLPVSAVTNKQQ